MNAFDLVVLGDVNPDLILAGPDLHVEFGQREALADRVDLRLGGSSAIVACGAARLGLNVAFVGAVGDDGYGHFCVDTLRRSGVDTAAVRVDPALSTGLSVILQRDGDRAIVTHLGSIAALRIDHVDIDLVRSGRHVHVGSYFLLDGLRADLPALFDEVRHHGTSTSLDTNDDPRDAFDVESVLDCCDVLLPNEAEACRIGRAATGVEAAAILSRRVGTVAVTTGSGAFVSRGDEFAEVEATPVEASAIVDAVGAGDNFDAGFLRGFVDGWDLERCLRSGLAASAESLRWCGGVSPSPMMSGGD